MSKLPSLGSSGGMVQTASRRIVLPVLTAALALMGAAIPVRAQTAFPSGDQGALTIQNNRTVPVTVWWEGEPFERELGQVEPMRTATFSVPKAFLREGESVELLLQPLGQNPLQAMAFVSNGSELALLIPATPHQLHRQESEMVAWQMGSAPVVSAANTNEDDD